MKMVYVLVGAVATAAAVGGVRSFAGSPPPPRAPITAAPEAQGAAVQSDQADEPAGDAVAGEVLELIDVPNYTYMRVGARGSEGSWVAVPTAKVAVGAKISVGNAMKMTDFKSTALNRTFPVIYFGNLDGAAPPHGMAPVAGNNPHANGADPHAAGANPHAGGYANGADPHAGFADQGGASPHGQAAASPVEVKPLPRAAGPNGKTVAEVNQQRTALVGKTVRIQGTVVKATGGILGKTYLHLRDGSGDAAAGSNDITVTTEALPKVGEVITVEGVVATDIDIGSGYKFPTLVQNATVVSK